MTPPLNEISDEAQLNEFTEYTHLDHLKTQLTKELQ